DMIALLGTRRERALLPQGTHDVGGGEPTGLPGGLPAAGTTLSLAANGPWGREESRGDAERLKRNLLEGSEVNSPAASASAAVPFRRDRQVDRRIYSTFPDMEARSRAASWGGVDSRGPGGVRWRTMCRIEGRSLRSGATGPFLFLPPLR